VDKATLARDKIGEVQRAIAAAEFQRAAMMLTDSHSMIEVTSPASFNFASTVSARKH
jgi:hypothetical protein